MTVLFGYAYTLPRTLPAMPVLACAVVVAAVAGGGIRELFGYGDSVSVEYLLA
jgi:hypothetical protein